MAWKFYTLASSGAFLVSYFAIGSPQVTSVRPAAAASPQAATNASPIIDLTPQAERLHVRIGTVTAYETPSRNTFRFVERVRDAAVSPRTELAGSAPLVPVAAVPSQPAFALVGVASSKAGEVTERTAILSSLRGVQLVKVGDTIDGVFKVVSIADDAVTLESTGDGTRSSLRLSNP